MVVFSLLECTIKGHQVYSQVLKLSFHWINNGFNVSRFCPTCFHFCCIPAGPHLFCSTKIKKGRYHLKCFFRT